MNRENSQSPVNHAVRLEISVTEHFNAWAAAGMTLGKLDQAQLLIEVGGGTGTIDFTVANVTSTR